MSKNGSKHDLHQTGIIASTGMEFLSSGKINGSRNSQSLLLTEKRDFTRFKQYVKPSLTNLLSPTEMIQV